MEVRTPESHVMASSLRDPAPAKYLKASDAQDVLNDTAHRAYAPYVIPGRP